MTNLLQIHMNCCRKYRLDTDGLYLSIILLFSSILCNSMISSYKTAFFRLSFTVAADVYEHIFAARCTAQHECDGEGKCLAACALYNDIGQGISSCGPLLRARHPPPSVRTMYSCTIYIILLSRQHAAEGRVASASGSTLFSKWGKSSGFYRLELRGSAVQGCFGFGV